MRELEIGKIKVSELVKEYKTPLYVYDESMIINRIDEFKDNFKSDIFQTEIEFASKSLCIKEIIRLVDKKGLSLDVVSLGEYATARSVGFPTNKIFFHGNNKSIDEIEICIKDGATIVCDNLDELMMIDRLSLKFNKNIDILIRINCGVSAHTHEYIVTAHIDSKFGIIFGSDDYNAMIKIINNSKHINLSGFHSHIGSQIFDYNSFNEAFLKFLPVLSSFDYPMVLNLGGGFGVKYTDDDSPASLNIVLPRMIKFIEKVLEKNNLKIKKLCIEPGRSIVAEAGYTLYTLGFTKETPNKTYYFVDGGMTDNIRPALYQAKYSADNALNMDGIKNKLVTIAGKCCESGDVIIEDILLPESKSGDVLVTYTTGAYGYSMASNYNKALIPGVVFVNNGKVKEVVKRQNILDVLEREV